MRRNAKSQQLERATAEMIDLLKRTGAADLNVAMAAQKALAQALTMPLRQGVLNGDIYSNIFVQEVLEKGATPEWPLDLFQPGHLGDYVAYTIPSEGHIPLRHVEADYLTIQTYEVGNSIDWNLKFARDARWNVVSRAMEVFEAGFVKKLSDDAWHVLLAAAAGRGIMVYDSAATAGQFTKRLVSLAKTTMRRNAGGNSTSVNRGKLTDLFISPEAQEDIRDWDLDQIDEVTAREIFVAADGTFNRVFGVTLHDIDELGVDQEYQDYAVDVLGVTMGTSDQEIVLGLDLSNRDSFVQPIREQLEVNEDPTLHRQRKAGVYGWLDTGFGVMDERRLLLGSL
jgi:hypothetical protein